MSECIVVTSGKGGVGKTTVSTNLGVALAKQGHRVVLVDADIGLRNLDIVLGMEKEVQYDYTQVMDGLCNIEDALVSSKTVANLFLLAAPQDKDKNAVTPTDMRILVDRLQEMEFDYIIVDCPAGIERGFQNAIAACDRAVVVVTPEVSSIRDADRVIDLLQKARIPKIQLLINRYRVDLVNRGDMLDVHDIWTILDTPLLGVLPESEEVLVASNKGQAITTHTESRMSSILYTVATRLYKEEIPFVDLHALTDNTVEESMWLRLRKWAGV